jgi:hypothetical protein
VISSNQFNDDGDNIDRVVVLRPLVLVVRSPPLWPSVVLVLLVLLFGVVDIVWLLLLLAAAIMLGLMVVAVKTIGRRDKFVGGEGHVEWFGCPNFLAFWRGSVFQNQKVGGWIHTRDGKRCSHSETRRLRPIILDVFYGLHTSHHMVLWQELYPRPFSFET